MLYALLVIACMVSQPERCDQYVTIFPQVTNVTACHLVAQMELTRWVGAHSELTLTNAYCVRIPVIDNNHNKLLVAGLPSEKEDK